MSVYYYLVCVKHDVGVFITDNKSNMPNRDTLGEFYLHHIINKSYPYEEPYFVKHMYCSKDADDERPYEVRHSYCLDRCDVRLFSEYDLEDYPREVHIIHDYDLEAND